MSETMNASELETGDELYNDAKGMSLGVVVDVTDTHVVTVDLAGTERRRPVENVETLLETSSLAPRDTPEWFEVTSK